MLFPFRHGADPYMLVVSMTGVKMGDRLLQIGCAHGGRLAAVASKVGLSGHAVAVVPDEPSAARARKGSTQAGVLVDIEIAPMTRLRSGDSAFDLAVIDNADGFIGTMRTADGVATMREALRVLRPGGRVVVVGALPRGGLAALLTRAPSAAGFDATAALRAQGFKSVRVLAEREGLQFVEGIKPRGSDVTART